MTNPESTTETTGKSLAVISEGLYLLNLLFPLFPLLILVWLYSRHRNHNSHLVRSHMRQSLIFAAISSGVFLAANLLIMVLGGYFSLHALIIFEVYYILVVPLFLIPGLIGLIKAMSAETYRFPLIGRKDEA